MRLTSSPAKAATLLSNASPCSSMYADSHMEGPLSSGVASSVVSHEKLLLLGRRTARPPARYVDYAMDTAGSLPRSQQLVTYRQPDLRGEEQNGARVGRQNPALESAAGRAHGSQMRGMVLTNHAEQPAVGRGFGDVLRAGFQAGRGAMELDADSPLSSFASRPSSAAKRSEECDVRLSNFRSRC